MNAEEYLAAVHAVLNRHDPEGLIAQGARPEEYAWEALMLAGARWMFRGAEDVVQFVAAVWEERFSRAMPQEKCRAVAADLWALEVVQRGIASGPLVVRGHHHDLVTRALAVGSGVDSAEDVRRIVAARFTHVLDLRSVDNTRALYAGTKIKALGLPSDDDGKPRTYEWMRDGIRFGVDALRGGGKILVHCAAGLNRSPSMAYGILRAMGYGQDRARDRIVCARRGAVIRYRDDIEGFLAGAWDMIAMPDEAKPFGWMR